MVKKICKICSKEFFIRPSCQKGKFCSYKCYWKFLIGRKLSKKIRKKLSKSQMGHKSWNKGKKCPQISKALTGRKLSPEHIKHFSEAHTGSKHWNWKGGESKSVQGYVYIYKPKHPRVKSRKYVKRAILVMEQKLGRYLKPEERVHHKGTKYPIDSIENKSDDRPENLELFVNERKHQKFHSSINPIFAKGHPPNQTSFKKGHPFIKGGEKGWFKKGQNSQLKFLLHR